MNHTCKKILTIIYLQKNISYYIWKKKNTVFWTGVKYMAQSVFQVLMSKCLFWVHSNHLHSFSIFYLNLLKIVNWSSKTALSLCEVENNGGLVCVTEGQNMTTELHCSNGTLFADKWSKFQKNFSKNWPLILVLVFAWGFWFGFFLSSGKVTFECIRNLCH